MKKFIKPNWSKSNLNISATLAEFLGAPNTNKTLPKLKSELAKGYKNNLKTKCNQMFYPTFIALNILT